MNALRNVTVILALSGFALSGCRGKVDDAPAVSKPDRVVGAGGSPGAPALGTPVLSCNRPSAGPFRLRQLTQAEYNRYPTFNAQMAKLMREETETVVDFVMGGDGGKLEALLKGSFTFIPKDLAKHYGVTFPSSAKGVARVELDARERAGVFTHASFLTAHSSAASISPVLLGKSRTDAPQFT